MVSKLGVSVTVRNGCNNKIGRFTVKWKVASFEIVKGALLQLMFNHDDYCALIDAVKSQGVM